MEDGSKHALALAGAAAALLLVRALVAAFESALAAVGLARAQALGAEAGAPARARALVTLTERWESTAALLRILDTLAALGAGVVAGVVGLRALPAPPPSRTSLSTTAALSPAS